LVRPKAKALVVFNDLYGKWDKNGIGEQMKKDQKRKPNVDKKRIRCKRNDTETRRERKQKLLYSKKKLKRGKHRGEQTR